LVLGADLGVFFIFFAGRADEKVVDVSSAYSSPGCLVLGAVLRAALHDGCRVIFIFLRGTPGGQAAEGSPWGCLRFVGMIFVTAVAGRSLE